VQEAVARIAGREGSQLQGSGRIATDIEHGRPALYQTRGDVFGLRCDRSAGMRLSPVSAREHLLLEKGQQILS
jgi:hypothetical protein